MFYQTEHIGTTGYFEKESKENLNFPLHMHRSFELILIDEGEMKVTVGQNKYLVQKNEAVLIFPNQIHSLSSTRSKHTLFIFSPSIIQSFFADKSGKLPRISKFNLSNELICALRRLTKQSSNYEIKGTFYAVCGEFEKKAEYYDAMKDKDDLLFKIFQYVEQNFSCGCSLPVLSESIGYNPDYISRFFKKRVGIPFNKYLNSRRLNHAAYLLSNTQEKCLYCAFESGYTSLRSFNRNFKEQFGISPKEYKKSIKRSCKKT